MRISTAAGEELRFWLTRRFTRALWPVLLQAADRDPQVAMQASPQAREAVLSFRHEQAVSGADFHQSFRSDPAPALPLGEVPVLLSRAQLKAGPGGRTVLCLHPQQNRGVEIGLTPELLHSLTRLLAETVRRADWDVALALPGDAAVAGDRQPVN